MKTAVFLSLLLVMPLVMPWTVVGAEDCEIVGQSFFERIQGEISTDWNAGVPYRKYERKTYPCASVTIRNTSWQPLDSSDFEIIATFPDQVSAAKRFGCDRKRLAFDETYSCTVCFEHDPPIESLKCTVR